MFDSKRVSPVGFRTDSFSGGRDLLRDGDLRRKEVPSKMQFFNALINLLRREDEGQGLAEYALILALIAIVAIIALIFLGTQVSGILSTVGQSV
jgi:pilus assembly protein Flp/PilA